MAWFPMALCPDDMCWMGGWCQEVIDGEGGNIDRGGIDVSCSQRDAVLVKGFS